MLNALLVRWRFTEDGSQRRQRGRNRVAIREELVVGIPRIPGVAFDSRMLGEHGNGSGKKCLNGRRVGIACVHASPFRKPDGPITRNRLELLDVAFQGRGGGLARSGVPPVPVGGDEIDAQAPRLVGVDPGS